MPLFKSEEEKEAARAAKEASREAERVKAEATREAARAEHERRHAELELQAFLASPVGQARTGYERGDQLFQYSLDVVNQRPVIFTYMHTQTERRTKDPIAILNAVCREGWDLVNGCFVFEQQGMRSNRAVLTNGETSAVLGTTMAYYVFRRCEANRSVDEETEAIEALAPTLQGKTRPRIGMAPL